MTDHLTGLSLEEKRALARKLLRDRNHIETGPFPLSEGQRALWYVYQLAPQSPAYNFVYAARVGSRIDERALKEAVGALFQRHALLRCGFSMPQRKPLLQLHDRIDPRVEIVDASGWLQERVIEHVRSAAHAPFDLRKARCARISLYRTAPGESVISLAVHHILADLWSMNLLVEELHCLYDAVIEGRGHALPPAAAQYSDYIRWQRDFLVSLPGRAAWEFWKETLADAPPCLELPTDRPRPKVQTYDGSAVSFPLEAAQCARLRELAASERTTLFTVILSAFAVFLRRYTGQDDLVIGTATAGRSRPEWERVVGYFLNQVPLRVQVDLRSDFGGLIRHAQRVVLGALEHQDFPFNLMVERLRPARDPSRPPIFQVMFIWDKSIEFSVHDSESGRAFGAELPPEPLVMEQCGAPFDLTLIVFENRDGLTISMRYNVDLFDRATIERMACHFRTLLAAAIDDPQRRLAELPILPPHEEKQILELSQGPVKSGAKQLPPFPVLFEEQVERSPEATAVIFEGRATTYRELNSRANRLAHYLRSREVKSGDLIGICLPRSSEMIATILAIWKAGAAYVPLDPTYPPLRLAGMIEDSSPAAIVTMSEQKTRLAGYSGPFVLLDQLAAIENEPDCNPVPCALPDDIAYAIFTSGSTGKPKAALLRHRGLSNLSEAQVEAYGIGPHDRSLQFASLSFDASVFELVLPLRVGATLVVAGQSAIVPGSDLATLIRDQRVTVVVLPPSVLGLLPDVDLPELNTIIVAGEACPAALVSKWASGRRFFNAYGPTETTVWASNALCTADGKPPSIGRPITNIRLLVLDEWMQLAPPGVAGELHIGGPGVALGYLNRPDLTLERFVPDPFTDDDDGVLYKTGDMVRLRADGELEFLGRRDHQIKIRGYRVDLGEAQEVLRQHPAVRDALVVAQTLEGCDGPSLVGYVVCADPAKCPTGEIRSFLRDRLPYYMVPTALIPMAAFPLSNSGKVDRSALPPVDGQLCRSERTAPHKPIDVDGPTDSIQAKLAQIWTTVLRNGPVGVHDNFFDLGGASLQTLEVTALAGDAGISVTPELILQHQTIAELAPRCKVVEGPAPVEALQPSRQAENANAPAPDSPGRSSRHTVIESIGTYLPSQKVSTEQVVSGCRLRLDLPVERMTGIKRRRVAGNGEYSIDLAAKALADCLSRSAYRPDEIGLLICCNISRCDGPDFQFSYEPSTAAQLQKRFGLAHALAFDVSNACAGTFTAIALADCFLATGIVTNALVVSGEYITHLTRTAQLEIESFVDPRLACLTLGDSGVALLLSSSERGGSGFQELDLMTLGAHSDLCVAKATDRSHGGAIMLTDALRASAVTIKEATRHALEALERRQWPLESIAQLIMHQTSQTTLDGAVAEINRVAGRELCHSGNTINNLGELGNTATNTHMLALVEAIRAGKVGTGSKVVFAVSGSGQTVGTALYQFGDASSLINRESGPESRRGLIPGPRCELDVARRVRVAAVAAPPDARASTLPCDALSMAVRAAETCIQEAAIDRGTVGLLLHAGVHRDGFQSEPALAAVAAGRLGINHHGPSPSGQKTLAFDLINGAVGPLQACLAAAFWIRAGRTTRALVTTSEVDNNARFDAPDSPGFLETGSAILLEEATDGGGFGRFVFRSFPEYVDDIRSFTVGSGSAVKLRRERSPDWERHAAAGLAVAVRELLEREKLRGDDFGLVLPPLGLSQFVPLLAEVLGLPEARFLDMDGGKGEYFTSSLGYGLLAARRSGRAKRGDRGLILAAGSGGQVGCCIYHF
jgi:amino acid adenylation domain-containing protein